MTRLLQILIISILVIFPFGELIRFGINSDFFIKPLDILVVIVGITWIGLKLFRKEKFPKQQILLLLPFSLVALLSLLSNFYWLEINQFVVSFLYFLRWIAYALIFIVVSEMDNKFKKIIFFFLLLDGVVFLLVGFYQYFLFSNLRYIYIFGWDEHLNRYFSTFFDPNFAGGFLVLFLFFLASLFLSLIRKKNYKDVFFVGSLLLLTIIAVLITFSRGAFLMLIIGSMVFFTLIQKKKLVLLIMGVLFLFVLLIVPKFNNENFNLLRVSSVGGRLANYSEALSIIMEHPLLGVGFNTYRYAKANSGIVQNVTNAPSHADAGADNSFLFITATTGIVGLAAYFFMWYQIFKKALFIRKKNKDLITVTVMSSIVGLFVDAFFINSLFFAPIMLWMWILIALMWKDN